MTEFQGLKRLTDDELRAFIIGVVDGKIFTLQHINAADQRLLHSIFMPLAMGALAEWPAEVLKEIGTVWEYYDAAMDRAINGYPMFMSCRVMWKGDWERASKKIVELEAKRKQEREELEL